MINYIEIAGYKSIKEAKIELKPINILIGGNGAGKSNFISFFKLLRATIDNKLLEYNKIQNIDKVLYFGKKRTPQIRFEISIVNNIKLISVLEFILAQSSIGDLVEKEVNCTIDFVTALKLGKANSELLSDEFASLQVENDYNLISQIRTFHFHDTSSTSSLRSGCEINDNLILHADGRNLAAFLYFLKIKHTKTYNRILQQIQSIAPYINSFILEPKRLNENEIELRWVDEGDLDSNFSAYDLSDGTLRYIALTVLLMQPTPPPVIIIDEPELGLHPFAITKLAAMMQLASASTQLIVATQSPALISNFTPEDIIVVDKSKTENQSVFSRLNSEDLKLWLEEFSLGDLWERDIINAAQPFTKL